MCSSDLVNGGVMRKFVSIAITALVLSTMGAAAQSISAAEIAKMVDQRMNDLNPYQALLNDPDPARAQAAMQIMLESGDADLTRMALEYGLLSPNPTVKRLALESWLSTGPVLSIRFDGTKVQAKDFPSRVKNYWNGNVSDGIGYWRVGVGKYLPDLKCFSNTDRADRCFITVNGDGVFLTPEALNGRAVITDTGQLEGTGALYGIEEPVSFSIRLLD